MALKFYSYTPMNLSNLLDQSRIGTPPTKQTPFHAHRVLIGTARHLLSSVQEPLPIRTERHGRDALDLSTRTTARVKPSSRIPTQPGKHKAIVSVKESTACVLQSQKERQSLACQSERVVTREIATGSQHQRSRTEL